MVTAKHLVSRLAQVHRQCVLQGGDLVSAYLVLCDVVLLKEQWSEGKEVEGAFRWIEANLAEVSQKGIALRIASEV